MPINRVRPAALLLAAALAHAGAQSVTQGDLTYSPPTCAQKTPGTIDCVLTVTYSGKSTDATVPIYPDGIRAYGPDGQAYRAASATSDTREITTQAIAIAVPPAIPIKVTLRFKSMPAGLATLRGLTVNSVTFQNVKVAGAVPVPVAVPTPRAVPAGYTLLLSRCVPQGQSLACTALLTPAR